MPTAIDDYIGDVLVECPSVPIVLARRAFIKAARHFCKESTYYRSNLADITLVADQTAYPISITDEILHIMSPVKVNDINVVHKTVATIEKNEPSDWRTRTGTQPSYFYSETEDSISFFPTPSEAATVTNIKAVLQPPLTATTLDDTLMTRYGVAIQEGAKSTLMVMPNKKWSNLQMASIYQDLFNEAIEEASARVISGFNQAKADRNHIVRGHYI